MDTHNPYTPAEPYRSMFAVEGPPRIIATEDVDPAVRIEGSRDVVLDERDAAGQLQRVMAATVSAEAPDGRKVAGRETPIDSRVLDQLRALGYVAHP